MPGYPRVDRGNPYLISRYDGLIVDAKPWGKGSESRDWWNGSDSYDSKELRQQDDNSKRLGREKASMISSGQVELLVTTRD
ncbi:unnamed protein product [Calypogeia fissa]